jgi:two-component system C4-dicarboxylate transport response regulator DctD
LAQGIHAASGRPGAFVACNCATLPEGLVESTLFGHAAGAFTGAAQPRAGLFRAAHQGTLFLDEVGALSAEAQAKLLRVIQTGEVRPVGQDRAIAVDVRLIAATLETLEDFRPDLRMRLAQSTLRLPGLVARREDLGLMLAEHLLGVDLQFDAGACAALFEHDWPGNMRELANLMGEMRIIAGWRSPRIQRGDLPQWAQSNAASVQGTERARLDDALRRHKGNVKAAAAWLGLSRQQTYVLIRRHGVDPNRYR